MIVLSLFDGMSCGQIALKELGIIPEIYYASEIDKHAIKQTQLNFKNTVQLGDVVLLKKAMCWKDQTYNLAINSKYISQKLKDKITFMRFIDWSTINLVLAGSPCQGFSFAGKQLAFDDPRSRLFFVFVEILNHIKKFNPDVKFLLENVNMKKSHLRVISEYVGVFPVNINSNLVSAQNRDRWYWTNIRTKQVGLFGELHSDIPQPKDRGILLKDILESEVDEKYFISQNVLDRIERKTYSEPKFDPDKTGTLNTKNNSGAMSIDSGTTFISVDGKAPNQRSSTGRSLDKRHNYQIIELQGVLNDNGTLRETEKANCLDANYHKGVDNHAQRSMVCIGGVINGEFKQGASKDFSQGSRVYNENSKSTCQNSGGGGMGAKTGLYAIQTKIRRLTPTECARLQTIPDWYLWECSDTQIYRMCGNGWTVEVIKHILSFLT